MPAQTKTPSRRVTPGTLRNLQRGRQKGGDSLSPVTLDAICAHYKQFKNKGKAAEYAGFSKQYANALFKKPGVKERLAILDEMEVKPSAANLQQAAVKINEEFKLAVSMVDEPLLKILTDGQTHEVRGDADRVKAGEVMYKRLKMIDPPKQVINNSAGAQAAAGGTVYEVYKSNWLAQKEARMSQQLEQEYGNQ